jgi:hypothetical protein
MKQNADIDGMDTILWRGIVLPGHEFCQIYSQTLSWHLDGTAVFTHEHQACRLNYKILCDETWHTRNVKVEGWLGKTRIDVQLRVDHGLHWWLNEIEVPDVMGCIDIDLNFSPSTNLIPIRRMNLAIGEAAEITAAWLRFPSFSLVPLPQRYHRSEDTVYRYESGGGKFVADLRVNRTGFVIDYPGIWQAETASEG